MLQRTADTAIPAEAAKINVTVSLHSSDTFHDSNFDYEPGEVYRLIAVRWGKFDKISFDAERVIIFTAPNDDLKGMGVVHAPLVQGRMHGCT